MKKIFTFFAAAAILASCGGKEEEKSLTIAGVKKISLENGQGLLFRFTLAHFLTVSFILATP
ncbi:MAG: hypothetical protein LBT94_01315 [Prevotellaceae bacterium]|nr:hypothetical protein [Prevotellaceae bacterium]